MQGTRIPSQVREDSIYRGATKPLKHNKKKKKLRQTYKKKSSSVFKPKKGITTWDVLTVRGRRIQGSQRMGTRWAQPYSRGQPKALPHPSGPTPAISTLLATRRVRAGWLLAEGHEREGGECGAAELSQPIMSVGLPRWP